MFLGMLAAILLIARIGARHQVRQVVGVGFLLISIAIIGLAAASNSPYWMQVLPLVLFGASIIGTKTVWTNAFFQTLIDRYIGLNAGINSATLLVGGALGGLLTTNLLAWFGESAFVRQAAAALDLSRTGLETTYQHISTTISVGEQAGLQDLASLISSSLYAHYQRAYVSGYSLTLLVIAALCMLAVLLILFGIIASLQFKPEDTPLDEDDRDAGIAVPSPGPLA
jgi:MFS family permease